MIVLSVDPGVKRHGCALWEEGELTSAWLMSSSEDPYAFVDQYFAFPNMIQGLAIEVPEVYSRATSVKTIAARNDLIGVAFAAGQLAGALGPDVFIQKFLPKQWKGQVPKNIMIERIQARLSAEESTRVSLPKRKDTRHNVWDAIGIGLKYWGRL